MASIGLFEIFLAFPCFLIFCYFVNKKHFDYLHIKKAFQSYPWNWPVLGMLPGLLARAHRINDSVEVLENSNMTFQFKGPWFLGMDMLVTVDPANIRHMYISNVSNYIKGLQWQENFEAYGEGIINADDERGSKLHKCYELLLHHQEFQRFLTSVTRNKLKDVLSPMFNRIAEEGMVVDLEDVLRRFFFDTTLTTTTGYDPRSLIIEMREDEFLKAYDDVGEAIVLRYLKPRFLWKLQKWIGFGQEKKMMEADAVIDRVCGSYISAKKNEIQQGLNNNHHEYGLSDPNDDKFFRDVIMSSIVAGRDTMASALSWFFWLLSEYPQVTTMIQEELKKYQPTTGSDKENLDQLVYLQGALCESMRLYPPTPFQRKFSVKQDVLPSGHKVDANSPIMVFLYAMGRMKAIWGEDALEFKPERWLSEAGGLRHEPSYKFFSFNAGPRTCLGKHTAIIHFKMIVVEILHNYDIEVVKGQMIEPLPGVTLRMKHGLRVTLKKRCSSLE